MAGKVLHLSHRGRGFAVLDHPAVSEVLPNFTGPFEAATLDVFDAVLPACDTMLDVGAHVGLTALYATAHGVSVTAFEPNPDTLDLLKENLRLNPSLAERITVVGAALSDTAGEAVLYAKAAADSGSSLHRTIERSGVLNGRAVGVVPLLDAATVLGALPLSPRTLIKLDTEGAEYRILPRIAALLADVRPVLHVSFHPFNIVAGGDAYATQLSRLRAAFDVAAALACYDFLYVFADGRWNRFGVADRIDLLRSYLLSPKRLPGIGSPQYGFVDAWAFAPHPIAMLDQRMAA